MKYLVAAAVLLGAGVALPAAAQTARIAHLSHGGSLAALDAAADNFGLPSQPSFQADSVRLVSDTAAVEYGRWYGYRVCKEQANEKTHLVRLAASATTNSQRPTKQELIKEYQNYRPHVKLIGFDSAAKPAVLAPVLKKQKVKRKKSTFFAAAPALPPHPGVALAVALVLGLAGAGWLLGERRPQPAA